MQNAFTRRRMLGSAGIMAGALCVADARHDKLTRLAEQTQKWHTLRTQIHTARARVEETCAVDDSDATRLARIVLASAAERKLSSMSLSPSSVRTSHSPHALRASSAAAARHAR